MYDGIRKAFGPTKKLTSALKSATGKILHNRDEQLGKWVQHVTLLYSRRNVVADAELQQMESLTTMDDLDNELTVQEFSKAITAMTPWKAPGSDGIPADLLQHCKFCLLPLLHDILVKCWREGMVSQDMCYAIKTRVLGRIATIFENFSSWSCW